MKTTCSTFLLLDIWPPSVENCSDSILMYTETRRTLVEWALPVFSDPHGESEVTMTSQNYREPRSTFEWGEYTVQYTAAKTRNAMTSQCVFDVTVLRKSTGNINQKQIHLISTSVRLLPCRLQLTRATRSLPRATERSPATVGTTNSVESASRFATKTSSCHRLSTSPTSTCAAPPETGYPRRQTTSTAQV